MRYFENRKDKGFNVVQLVNAARQFREPGK